MSHDGAGAHQAMCTTTGIPSVVHAPLHNANKYTHTAFVVQGYNRANGAGLYKHTPESLDMSRTPPPNAPVQQLQITACQLQTMSNLQ